MNVAEPSSHREGVCHLRTRLSCTMKGSRGDHCMRCARGRLAIRIPDFGVWVGMVQEHTYNTGLALGSPLRNGPRLTKACSSPKSAAPTDSRNKRSKTKQSKPESTQVGMGKAEQLATARLDRRIQSRRQLGTFTSDEAIACFASFPALEDSELHNAIALSRGFADASSERNLSEGTRLGSA
jgi:hypothetical protein